MRRVNAQHWKRLEALSGTLFLAAGALVVIYSALHGIEAATDVILEPNPFEFGYVLGFLGLLGLYPTVVEESPWMARVGAVAAVLGMIGLSAFTVLHLGELAGLIEPGRPDWITVFIPFPLAGFVIGYLSMGSAVLLGSDRYRTLGLLLLAPGLIVVVMLIQIFMGWTSQLQAFVISAGEAMAHLAIGATLQMDTRQGKRERPSREAEVELPTND